MEDSSIAPDKFGDHKSLMIDFSIKKFFKERDLHEKKLKLIIQVFEEIVSLRKNHSLTFYQIRPNG